MKISNDDVTAAAAAVDDDDDDDDDDDIYKQTPVTFVECQHQLLKVS